MLMRWLACAAILVGLVACGKQQTPVSADSQLTIALQADGKTLDPHHALDAGSMHLIENMYSTLMRRTAKYGEIKKDLLTDYQIGDDFKQYTLTIRDDAVFHSGRKVTAADVAYSLKRIKDSGIRSEPLQTLHDVQVKDARTLVLTFDEPMSPLMTYLADPMYAVVDRQVVEANGGELDRADAGSGPFELVKWEKDRRCVLKKFDRYYVPDQPRVDRLVYRPIPDETARSITLTNGEVDVVLDVPIVEVARLEGEKGVTVQSVPGTFWEYIGLNCREKPLNDARVRQAITWAVDRQVLNEAVKQGRATPLEGGPIPPKSWAHADLSIYPKRDVDKAKELLAEAGYPDGFNLTLIVGSDFPYQVKAAGIVKQMLADVGINVELQRLESTMFFDRLNRHDFQATLVGWVGFVGPDQWLYAIYHTEGKYNQQGYSNSQVDKLLEKGRKIGDREKRKTIYTDAQRLIAEDAPTIFLYLNPQITAWRDDVKGFDVTATATTISARKTSLVK